MALLGDGELEPGDDPAGLFDVVVTDRGLEPLAQRLGLAELPPQPAKQAHPRRAFHRVETHTASLLAVTKPIRS